MPAPSLDSSSPAIPQGPSMDAGLAKTAAELAPVTGKIGTEGPNANFSAFGTPEATGVVKAPLAEVSDFNFPGRSVTVDAPMRNAFTPGQTQGSPSVLDAVERGASKAEVMQEAGKVMDRAKVDPAWFEAHPAEFGTAEGLIKQQQGEMPSKAGPQQNLDPERGLRQQMTQGGPERTNTLERGQGGPNQGLLQPGQDQAVTATKLDQPQAASPIKDGLGKVMDWVKENPVASAAIAAVAVYALQSTLSSEGGSVMGALKYGGLAWGAIKAGGALLGNDSKDTSKKDETSLWSKFGSGLKDGLGWVVPGFSKASEMASKVMENKAEGAVPTSAPVVPGTATQAIAPMAAPNAQTQRTI